MHVTIDDVIFCYSLECVYIKYESQNCLIVTQVLLVKTWLLIACDTAFYAILIYCYLVYISRDHELEYSILEIRQARSLENIVFFFFSVY